MGKLSIDKLDSLNPIRTDIQRDLNKTGDLAPLSKEKGVSANEDQLDISSRGSEVGSLVEQLKAMPDVRTEKINSLQDQITAGDYNPSGGEIADAILKSKGS